MWLETERQLNKITITLAYIKDVLVIAEGNMRSLMKLFYDKLHECGYK